MHLLDGNNLSGFLWGDSRKRKPTLDLVLDAYRGRRKRAILVFDGPPDPAVPRERTVLGNVEVRLAASGDADALLAALARKHRGALVVTADAGLAAACRRTAAQTVSPKEFIARLEEQSHAV
jgi:predicted nucleic acid-binding protein